MTPPTYGLLFIKSAQKVWGGGAFNLNLMQRPSQETMNQDEGCLSKASVLQRYFIATVTPLNIKPRCCEINSFFSTASQPKGSSSLSFDIVSISFGWFTGLFNYQHPLQHPPQFSIFQDNLFALAA